MRTLFGIILVVGAIWDTFTTVYGTLLILGEGPLQIFAALLFAALILGFVLNTKRILRLPGGFISFMAMFFWLIALGYDFYTSWTGNKNLLMTDESSTSQFIILLGLSILVTGSPILLPIIWRLPIFQQNTRPIFPSK